MNTSFRYLYRDGSNYKVSHDVVFAGEATTFDVVTIGGVLLESDYMRGKTLEKSMISGLFIPGQVGLPDLQNRFYQGEIATIDALTEASRNPAADLQGVDLPRLQELRDHMAATKPCWDPDEDHIYHEVTGLSLTDREPTDPRSFRDFLEAIKGITWDEDYLPPFHAEMVANHEAKIVAQNQEDPQP